MSPEFLRCLESMYSPTVQMVTGHSLVFRGVDDFLLLFFGGRACLNIWGRDMQIIEIETKLLLEVAVVAPFRMNLVMPSKSAMTLVHPEWITPHVNFNRATGQASDHWQSRVMGRPLANTQVHCTAPRASVADRDDLTILPYNKYKNMSCKRKTHVFFGWKLKF